LKENPRITAIVTAHNTQTVGTSTALQELNRKVPDDCSIMGALVGIETSPQHSTGAPLDRYDEPSNANCSQCKLQLSGNYEEDRKWINSICVFARFTLIFTENAVWAAGGLVSRNCANAPGASDGIARIDLQTNTIIGTISIPCAFSVASAGISQGVIWVGSGSPGGPMMITQVEPDLE
jgi:hypothetical protein